MRKKHTILLLGIVVIVSGWCMTSCGSPAQPSEGVVDVWATWGDDSDQLQALLERFSQPSGLPVRVTTRVRSEDLLEALAGAQPPDVVILSSSDLVAAHDAQGLVEPLGFGYRALRVVGQFRIDFQADKPVPTVGRVVNVFQ